MTTLQINADQSPSCVAGHSHDDDNGPGTDGVPVVSYITEISQEMTR
jgi:hypothetical protein